MSSVGGGEGSDASTSGTEAGKGKTGRNEPNQPRQPNDDQVITGSQGALGQGERFSRPDDVTRADRYKPENNPERNPEPVTGNESQKPTVTGSTSKNPQQEEEE